MTLSLFGPDSNRDCDSGRNSFNRPSIFASWNNREATSLGAAPTRAKALRIKPLRTSALTAGFCERLAGHLSVRRKGHFEFNATECGSGEGLAVKNVVWMSLGAMGSAAKAVLAWKSIVATRNGSARIEPRGDGQTLTPCPARTSDGRVVQA